MATNVQACRRGPPRRTAQRTDQARRRPELLRPVRCSPGWRAAPYAKRADQAGHVRAPTLKGKASRLRAAERRKPFSGKRLLADALGPWQP